MYIYIAIYANIYIYIYIYIYASRNSTYTLQAVFFCDYHIISFLLMSAVMPILMLVSLGKTQKVNFCKM